MIGFDDELIYEVLKGNANMPDTIIDQIDREICIRSFEEWKLKNDRTQY